MSDFLKVIESEIEDTERAINEATIKLSTLQNVRRKYLDSQSSNNGSKPAPITPGIASLIPVDDGNKTQLVLDAIFGHQSEGVKAGRVFTDIAAKGITINKNYVYSILNRLKKGGKIEQRRGKYFPTLGTLAHGSSAAKTSA